MNEILLNYIVQAVLGGASGYITNDYAINMLFKEYTPLKLGGVIKKTRVEFIENLSSMVENDIINKEKLHEIFNSRDFRDKFEKLTCDFYENCLQETIGQVKFSDIDGFEPTMKKTDNYVQKIFSENIDGLIELIIDNFDAGCFLTKIQSDKIAESLYGTIKDVIKNTDVLENSLKYLYKNNKELKLSDVLGSNIRTIDVSINKLAEIAANKVPSLESIAGFNSAVNEALDIFYDKHIKDVIKFDKKLKSSFISYITDKDNVHKVCRSLVSYGKTIDKSLYSILDPAFESSLKAYIQENLPYVTEQLVSYVQKNSLLIDGIIEDSIDEVIGESQGLRSKLLYSVKNAYFNNLSKKHSIVQRIISFIRQSTEPERLSSHISKRIINRLDTVTIRDIFIGAENSFDLDKAYEIAAEFLSKSAGGILENAGNYVLQLRVKEILPRFDFSAEKLLSSGPVLGFLKSKSQDLVKAILCKELSELASEDKLGHYAVKAAQYIKKEYCNNKNSIADYISEKIKNFEINKNNLKSKELMDLVHKESYDKYKEEASKLKDVNLSFALDKLNSIENLSKNSSETLRKYIINNTDSILKGSIKSIVTDNLNKLSDDELVNFANDFIGRELKPIMLFGGVLGIAAGLILAAFQNTPLVPSEINILNMAVYAFVGFITNVIAINMIFKPYRKIKILSKLPFFSNFSLGYIVKNQKNFAESTAHYIDTGLLSKKSINEMFEKHKDSIKQSFVKNIGENDYAVLSSLLVKNKEGIVKGTLSFLKKNILKNLSAFSNYLYGEVSRIKLSKVLTDTNIDSLSSYASENIKTDNIKNRIYSLIKSDKKFNTVFSTEFFIEILCNGFKKLYDKTIDFLNPATINNEILKHNNKYNKYSDNIIEEVFTLNDIAGFSQKVNTAVFSENFKFHVSSAIIILFNKLFDRDKSFGELFEGRLKVYIDKNLTQILKTVTQKIKDNLSESKTIVSTSLRAEFKNNLGFIQSGVYALMDGDEIIDSLVNKIMTEKLPLFMDVKKDEINKIMAGLIIDRFYMTPVEALYVNLNKMQINEVVENYLSANKEKLESKIKNLTEELYNKIRYKNVRSILEFFSLGDLEGFIKSYESEINAFAAAIHPYLTDNKNGIDNDISDYLVSSAEEFMDLKVSDIFIYESKDDIDKIIDNITKVIKKNDAVRKTVKSLEEEYIKYFSNISLDYYIDKDEFFKSTEMFVQSLLMNDELKTRLKNILFAVFDDASEHNFSFIDSKTKEYAVNAFVDASIESLRRNLDDMLKSVEFEKIAQEEIEKMEPDKIHQMFNSFGKKYFRKLMLYGFGGFVFGINMYVGFALTGLKIFSDTIKKDR
ncbi:MAG TPA: DUF445 family protein [Sedimentibacter sp.]|nr:DUF445 family protein [Sedimentibacter sp.]